MTRRWWLALVWVLMVGGAQAHTVLTDGPIGVTMHVDPDDAPVAGQPSRFVFWFKDLTGRLQASECQGSFTVDQNGQLVGRAQPLFSAEGNALVSIHEITFPRPGVYTVRVTGAPKAAVLFPSFRLVFNVRVSGGDSTNSDDARDPFPYILGATIVITLLLWWGFWPRRPHPR